MRTTLDLPDRLFRELKAQAAFRGMKLKELVAELLQRGLDREEIVLSPRSRSALPVIRKATGARHASMSNQEIENLLLAEDADGRD